MRVALLIVFALNILDAFFTSFVVSNALAVEVNPLMGALLDYGIVPFVVIKLGIIIASMRILWKYRSKRITQIGTGLCVLIYMSLILYFVYNFSVT
jgi:hypothetical protein